MVTVFFFFKSIVLETQGYNRGVIVIKTYFLWYWACQVVLGVRNPPASAGDTVDTGLIPGLGKSPGGGNGSPLQYSCLENSMDRRAWQATVCGTAKRYDWTTKHIEIFQIIIYFLLVVFSLISIWPEYIVFWGFANCCPGGQTSVFISDILLEHSHTHLFMYYLWLLSCYNSRMNSYDIRHLVHELK